LELAEKDSRRKGREEERGKLWARGATINHRTSPTSPKFGYYDHGFRLAYLTRLMIGD